MIGLRDVSPIKTGVTSAAGPCLTTAIELDPCAQMIIMLLSCKDMECRWEETYKLAKWATHRLTKIRQFEAYQ